jgi:hypothetical protein
MKRVGPASAGGVEILDKVDGLLAIRQNKYLVPMLASTPMPLSKPFCAASLGRDVDPRRVTGAVSNGVPDQVLKKLL